MNAPGDTRSAIWNDERAHELEFLTDLSSIRRAIEELDKGMGQEALAFLDELRAELLSMKG